MITSARADNADNALDRLMTLVAAGGSQAYHGEVVSQLEHALQCGQLARSAGADKETVAAALLHDIGHLLESAGETREQLGVIDHDRCGAEFLRELGFPDKVVQLVAAHVAAKRYLVAV